MLRLGGLPDLGPARDRATEKSRRAAEQGRPELKAERATWSEEFAAIDPARLASGDEAGAGPAMGRAYGRAPSGVRGDGPGPHGRREVTTPTAAVRLDGVPPSARLASDGATDSCRLETHVGRCLAPTPRPGDIAVMGDLASHEAAEVGRLIAAAGAGVRYPPASGPDLGPIERLFGELKGPPRSAATRAVEAAIEAMGDALRAVRLEDIPGRFGHGGCPTARPTVTVNEKPH